MGEPLKRERQGAAIEVARLVRSDGEVDGSRGDGKVPRGKEGGEGVDGRGERGRVGRELGWRLSRTLASRVFSSCAKMV
jgi:hypothetical protein